MAFSRELELFKENTFHVVISLADRLLNSMQSNLRKYFDLAVISEPLK